MPVHLSHPAIPHDTVSPSRPRIGVRFQIISLHGGRSQATHARTPTTPPIRDPAGLWIACSEPGMHCLACAAPAARAPGSRVGGGGRRRMAIECAASSPFTRDGEETAPRYARPLPLRQKFCSNRVVFIGTIWWFWITVLRS